MLGLLSDAHGNLPGFAMGLAVLKRHGARRFAFLGDALGYIPTWDVVDELDRLRDQFVFVRGNHEEMVLSPGAGRRDSVFQHQPLRDDLTPTRAAFVEAWPGSVRMEVPCGSLLLVHGSPGDTQNGYLYPDTPLEDIDVGEAYVFCGHTHRPFIRRANGTTFVNVGSCGLPRDDGRYGSAALLDVESGEVRILRFDIAEGTEVFLRGFETVHPSVRGLFSRRSNSLFGEFDG